MNQRNLALMLITFTLIIISCKGNDLQKQTIKLSKEVEVQVVHKLELVKGQTEVIKDNGIKVTLENVAEPSGNEARFVGLANIKIEIPNKEPKILQFEMESPTAPRGYDVDGISVEFRGYSDGKVIVLIGNTYNGPKTNFATAGNLSIVKRNPMVIKITSGGGVSTQFFVGENTHLIEAENLQDFQGKYVNVMGVCHNCKYGDSNASGKDVEAIYIEAYPYK